MKITDQIGSSHVEMMNKILDFIISFDVYKLLYAIYMKKIDTDTIESYTLDIREQNVKLLRQKKYLLKFAETFNKEYTTEDNKCFDTSARLSFKMRSGIKGIKKSVRKFCKRSHRKLKPGEAAPQAIDKSLLSAEEYMKDLFGLETYPECVKELFQEMITLHGNMMECLKESLRVLSEEKETREDYKQCLELLKHACEKCQKNQIIFVEAMRDEPAVKAALLNSISLMPNAGNPVLEAYKNSGGDKGYFAATYFHNCTLEDVSKISFYKTVKEADGDPMLISCMTIFSCEKEKALQINYAIENFDLLLPIKCKGKKIPAINLHVFMKWCSTQVGYEAFLNYFNKLYKEAGGKWNTIEKSALSGAAAKCAKNHPKYLSVKKTMEKQLDKMCAS